MLIRSCRRLERFNRTHARPICVEFVHQEDVEYVIENRSYLSEGVFADYEYSLEVERKRRLLLPILRAAKQMVSYRKFSRLEGDELVIHGRHYTLQTLHRLPDDLNPFKITTQEDEQTIGFFGAINPLSNFYEAGFKLDGEEYLSSEQYIQAQKAKYFRDRQAYDRIMGCTKPLDCKEEARTIRGFEKKQWDIVAKELCQPGIQAKFEQNSDIMKILLSTGNKRIVESARDKLWGTGFVLGSDDCLDSTKWTTRGIMGEILEQIRSSYQSSDIQHESISFDMAPILSSLRVHADPCVQTGSVPASQTPRPVPMDQSSTPVPDITRADTSVLEVQHPSSNISELEVAVNRCHENGITSQERYMPETSESTVAEVNTDSKQLDAASVPLPPLPDPKV